MLARAKPLNPKPKDLHVGSNHLEHVLGRRGQRRPGQAIGQASPTLRFGVYAVGSGCKPG